MPYSVRERYATDPHFKSLVDLMVNHIMRCNYTPSEMREAALLASIKCEMMELRPRVIFTEELEEALAVIDHYKDSRR